MLFDFNSVTCNNTKAHVKCCIPCRELSDFTMLEYKCIILTENNNKFNSLLSFIVEYKSHNELHIIL